MFKYVLHYPITDDAGNRTEHTHCYSANAKFPDESKLYSYLLGSLPDEHGINLAGEDWSSKNVEEIAELLKDKVRIEFVIDWDSGDTALHWINNYPTHGMTRNLAAHYFGIAYPEGEQTTESIKKFYDENIANLRLRKHKIQSQPQGVMRVNRPTQIREETTEFEVDVSQRTYGQCSYIGDGTWSGNVSLPVRRIRAIIEEADGDEGEINDALEDALKHAWQEDNNIENGDMDYTYEEYSENDCDPPRIEGRFINAFVAGLIREYEAERDAQNAEDEDSDDEDNDVDNEENREIALDVGEQPVTLANANHDEVHPQITFAQLNEIRAILDDVPNQIATAATADTVTITSTGHHEQWIEQPYPATTSPSELANTDDDDVPLTEGMADQIREIVGILNDEDRQAPTQNTRPLPF